MHTLDMSSFQHLEYEPNSQTHVPEMSIHYDHIVFNHSVLKQLGDPKSIYLGFDPEGRRVLIQGMKKPGKGTIDFQEDRKRRDFGIYTLERVQFLRALMPEWKDESRFKIAGVYYETENAIVFSLRDARPYTSGSGYRSTSLRNKARLESK